MRNYFFALALALYGRFIGFASPALTENLRIWNLYAHYMH